MGFTISSTQAQARSRHSGKGRALHRLVVHDQTFAFHGNMEMELGKTFYQ